MILLSLFDRLSAYQQMDLQCLDEQEYVDWRFLLHQERKKEKNTDKSKDEIDDVKESPERRYVSPRSAGPALAFFYLRRVS